MTPSPKCREIFAQQSIECLSRIASGAFLVLLAYFVIEQYKEKAAYQNAYLERRLERLGNLWIATDHHGAEVLKVLAQEPVPARDVESLGEKYYAELASAGLFLGQEAITGIRTRVGDIFLNDQANDLVATSPATKAQAIKRFRRNWLDVLRDLEELGEEHGK